MRKQVGYASFFDCVDKRITVIDEQANFDLANAEYIPFFEEAISRNKRIECTQCGSHIGALLFDGPYPNFIRYVVNSELVKF